LNSCLPFLDVRQYHSDEHDNSYDEGTEGNRPKMVPTAAVHEHKKYNTMFLDLFRKYLS